MNHRDHIQVRRTVEAIILAILIPALLICGCNRGDLKVTPVVEGQAAPHAGFNLGPDTWLEPGNEVKVTGAVIWIKGVDPNSILGDPE